MEFALKEMDESGRKDDRIVWITDKDLEIVRLWQDIITSRLKDKDEVLKMRTVEISQVIRENTQRNLIIKDLIEIYNKKKFCDFSNSTFYRIMKVTLD